MTESSGCFWTCTRNSGHTLVFTLAYTHRMELSYVSGDVMIERSLSYMLLLMVPEQAKDSLLFILHVYSFLLSRSCFVSVNVLSFVLSF